ncbi:hypothetical protein JST97_20680 [bacterium]|nr:hypothetical protein [bacterium]
MSVLAVPSDCRSDEIRFQLFRCAHCGRGSAGACEESRRGSMDNDCVDHYAYAVEPAEWQRAQEWIKLCPRPEDEDCGCCAHKQLGAQDQSGRWLGLKALRVAP